MVIKVDFVGCLGWRIVGLGDGLVENKVYVIIVDEIWELN